MNAVLKPIPQLSRERMDDVLGEIEPLLRAHFDEIAHYKDIPLDPDWGLYGALECAGRLRIYTARIDGRLIGYAVFAVSRSPHYNKLYAIQDILFLSPEYRGGMLGARLIKYADECLRLDGVVVVKHHVKAAHDFGPLLERLGYEKEDVIYTKRLG